MTQQKSSKKLPGPNAAISAMSLEELRAQRRERMETNKRVEDLKLRLLRITDHHMDHVVRLIRRWLHSDEE